MERTLTFVLSMLGIALIGCTGNVQTSSQAAASGSAAAAGSGAGGAGSASSAAGPTGSSSSSGAGGEGGGGPSGALSGHYMQMTIGNCINFESWFSFDAPPAFTHTDVDRNYCGPHSVTPEPGTYKLSGAKLGMTWTSPKGSPLREFTHVRIDPFPEGPIVPFPQGYVPGTAAINAMAYARVGGSLTWHRDDRSATKDASGLFDQKVTVDVELDAPPGDPAGPTACSMKVTLAADVTVDAAKPPDTGSETFTLPCTYDHDKTLPWIRITANGFEDSASDGSWMDFMTQLGVWKKYPSWVSEALYEAFRPVLFYVPGDNSRLFHDVWMAWYQEMKDPPPVSVP